MCVRREYCLTQSCEISAMMPVCRRCLFLCLLAVTWAAASGYRVLVVFPVMGKSHSILGEGYVNILLDRGHQVTYITPFKMKRESENLTQVVMQYDMTVLKEFEDKMNIQTLLVGNSTMKNPLTMGLLGNFFSSMALNDTNVINMMQDPTRKFDLVVVEWLFSELHAGFGALYNCPLVWSSSMDLHPMVARLVDSLPNPAYTPDLYSTYRAPFTFLQRVKELWTTLMKIVIEEFIVIPKATEAYERSFVSAASKLGRTMPPYRDVIYSGALMLLNSHPSLGDAPTLPQNVKEIGGYHINPPAPLPQDLQKIMDEAKEGVIFFSLGSNMKSKDLPETMKRQILDVLRQLKQTVLWKFEEELKDVPNNVHVRAWLPQQSLLNHRNLRVFITHGGLLSMTETVHFGVPVVMVPLFADQFLNAHLAVKRGFAVQVDFTYDLARDLKIAVEELLSNPKYSQCARELSTLYHDRPLRPAEELAYWLEYTARHGSLAHLRSPALTVAWYQALYLDLLLLLASALVAMVLLVKILIGRLRGGKKKKKD